MGTDLNSAKRETRWLLPAVVLVILLCAIAGIFVVLSNKQEPPPAPEASVHPYVPATTGTSPQATDSVPTNRHQLWARAMAAVKEGEPARAIELLSSLDRQLSSNISTSGPSSMLFREDFTSKEFASGVTPSGWRRAPRSKVTHEVDGSRDFIRMTQSDPPAWIFFQRIALDDGIQILKIGINGRLAEPLGNDAKGHPSVFKVEFGSGNRRLGSRLAIEGYLTSNWAVARSEVNVPPGATHVNLYLGAWDSDVPLDVSLVEIESASTTPSSQPDPTKLTAATLADQQLRITRSVTTALLEFARCRAGQMTRAQWVTATIEHFISNSALAAPVAAESLREMGSALTEDELLALAAGPLPPSVTPQIIGCASNAARVRHFDDLSAAAKFYGQLAKVSGSPEAARQSTIAAAAVDLAAANTALSKGTVSRVQWISRYRQVLEARSSDGADVIGSVLESGGLSPEQILELLDARLPSSVNGKLAAAVLAGGVATERVGSSSAAWQPDVAWLAKVASPVADSDAARIIVSRFSEMLAEPMRQRTLRACVELFPDSILGNAALRALGDGASTRAARTALATWAWEVVPGSSSAKTLREEFVRAALAKGAYLAAASAMDDEGQLAHVTTDRAFGDIYGEMLDRAAHLTETRVTTVMRFDLYRDAAASLAAEGDELRAAYLLYHLLVQVDRIPLDVNTGKPLDGLEFDRNWQTASTQPAMQRHLRARVYTYADELVRQREGEHPALGVLVTTESQVDTPDLTCAMLLALSHRCIAQSNFELGAKFAKSAHNLLPESALADAAARDTDDRLEGWRQRVAAERELHLLTESATAAEPPAPEAARVLREIGEKAQALGQPETAFNAYLSLADAFPTSPDAADNVLSAIRCLPQADARVSDLGRRLLASYADSPAAAKFRRDFPSTQPATTPKRKG